VKDMLDNPGNRWWAADATEAASRSNQQRLIWKYLPSEWRNEVTGVLGKGRSKTTKVKYSVSGGFTENSLVLPNGSELEFKFYEQKIASLQAVEINGFWGDELLPLDWIDTIEYRLVNRNGLFLLTFTPISGYTQTVAYYLDDATVLEEAQAELLPNYNEDGKVIGYEKVPRVLQCKRKNARVIFFHTKDNPFGNYEGMKEQVKIKSREHILMRVYGVATKAVHVQFPMFKPEVHVLSLNRFKEIEKTNEDGVRYQLVDPCSGRNWFMIWVYCPYPKKWIVYREWPSYGHPQAYIPGVGDIGEWALSGDAHDGERGPAQEALGFGLERYKQEIERMEGTEENFERWIDSRYSNTPKTEREGTTTLIEQLEEIGLTFHAMTAEKTILNTNDGSLDMINSALYYDEETPVGAFLGTLARINEPQLLVTENCPNVIFALKNWTGRDGGHGACKDPVDCLRGLFLSELDFVSGEMLAPRSDWNERRVA